MIRYSVKCCLQQTRYFKSVGCTKRSSARLNRFFIASFISKASKCFRIQDLFRSRGRYVCKGCGSTPTLQICENIGQKWLKDILHLLIIWHISMLLTFLKYKFSDDSFGIQCRGHKRIIANPRYFLLLATEQLYRIFCNHNLFCSPTVMIHLIVCFTGTHVLFRLQ